MWFALQTLISPIYLSILSIAVQNDRIELVHRSSIEQDELSKFERNGLKRFREEMNGELLYEYEQSDDFLIRWLRECNVDINCATAMLRKALQWRKENDMNNILNKTFLPIKSQPCFVDGVDKSGGPILMMRVGDIDIRKLITSGHFENLLHHTDQCVERFIKASIWRTSDNELKLNAGITLVDADGFSLRQHGCLQCLSLLRQLSIRSKLFYPRYSRLVVVVNAPRFTQRISDMVKPILSPYLQKAFRVFGADKEEWSSFLLSHISKEELLVEYGGTKTRNSRQ